MKQFIAVIIYLITDSGSFMAQSVQIPEIMSEDREMAMALSAAPEHLRAEAGVYVLRESGFVRARDSRNGFTCIVNRDHPRALKPCPPRRTPLHRKWRTRSGRIRECV